MNTKSVEVEYERNFDLLLHDSIDFLIQSNLFEPNSIGGFKDTLARGSIIFSILLLESAANNCLEELRLEKSLFNDIERLPTISKFDFYLRAKFRNKKLNRGNTYVEGIRELKSVRDSFVHMKKHRVEWEVEEETELDGSRSSEVDRTSAIKLAKNPACWQLDDAKNAMRNTHNFFNHFFKDTCRYSKKKVNSILFSVDQYPGENSSYMIPGIQADKFAQLEKWKIDLSYMKLSIG